MATFEISEILSTPNKLKYFLPTTTENRISDYRNEMPTADFQRKSGLILARLALNFKLTIVFYLQDFEVVKEFVAKFTLEHLFLGVLSQKYQV